MGSGRGWLSGDWPSTGGVLNITAAAWTAGILWRSRNKKRTQNVSEYMLVLALCLVKHLLLSTCLCFVAVSDVYIRRDLFGTITPTSLIADNFVYFLSNENSTVTVDIQFKCNHYSYFFEQEITVGLYSFITSAKKVM